MQCTEGGTIAFKRMFLGNGADAGLSAENLSNPLVEIPLSNIERKNDFVTLVGTFNNNNVTGRFRATELGIFAECTDKSQNSVEILFAYGYASETEADIIPASTDYILETTEQVQIYVGDMENITAIINDSMVTASKAELNKHIEDKNNPHGITKEQIGLGNVTNVSTNDQTPTFVQPVGLKNIISGETLSVILGKVQKAIDRLYTHIIDYQNPHKCTAQSIGAAEREHQHSTNDITSGVLGPARGGTGVSSIQALAESLTGSYGIPKIVTGSYVGEGKHGERNMNTLVFETQPKLLIIYPQYEPTLGNRIIVPSQVNRLCVGERDTGTEVEYLYLYFSWNNGTVWWYSLDSANNQLNSQGRKYLYLAFL